MSDGITQEYSYLGTQVKVSFTDKKNTWHVTLWHKGQNLDMHEVRGSSIEAAGCKATAGYILSGKYGDKVTTNLRVIRALMKG